MELLNGKLTRIFDVVPRVITSPFASPTGSLRCLDSDSGRFTASEFKRVPFRLPISNSSHFNFCHQHSDAIEKSNQPTTNQVFMHEHFTRSYQSRRTDAYTRIPVYPGMFARHFGVLQQQVTWRNSANG